MEEEKKLSGITLIIKKGMSGETEDGYEEETEETEETEEEGSYGTCPECGCKIKMVKG